LEISILGQITIQKGSTFTLRFQTVLLVTHKRAVNPVAEQSAFRSWLCSSGNCLSFDEH